MKNLLTLFLLLFSLSLFAQAPPNDDCDGIIDLGTAPFCPEGIFYSNTDATPSDVLPGSEAPLDCNSLGEPQTDVWFQFTADTEILDYTITVTGLENPDTGENSIVQPVVVIYRGDEGCVDIEQLQCAAANIGDTSVEMTLETALTPGITYFMRISDYSLTGAPNSGAFQLCVEETVLPPNLCEDIITTECEGEIYDCGGPDGDYNPGDNFTLTISPEGGAACINLSLGYYNIDAFGDVINFYDGPTASGAPIGTISGGQNGSSLGGACYQVSASSGSLTMQFVADGSVEFEGFYAFWECSTEPCETFSVVQVTDEVTEEEIEEIVSTAQSVVEITNIDCPEGAYGTFDSGDDTNLGLNRGLVMTSGSVLDDPVNFQSGVGNPGTVFASTGHQTPGDADLDYLSSLGDGQESNDACVIEFEVFANTNQLNFEYIFGSEEYPEFVNSFNDIFAFLISGPGIEGDPNNDNKLNMAVLPDGSGTPVEINSVNDGLNWEYYRDNQTGPSVVYDGLTSDFQGVKKSLTATADVIPCNTYSLKMAIADRGDTAFDSGVFISEITGGVPEVSVNFQNGIDYLVEECTNVEDFLVIDIGAPLDNDQDFEVILGGTAEQGIDYDLVIPPVVTIPAGDTVVTFPITPITDGITEGQESITVTLRANFGCGDIVLSETEILLEDALNIEIFAIEDTTFVCTDSCVTLQVSGAPNYVWSPASVFDVANIANPTICPTESQQVFVVGFLGNCTATDDVWIEVVDPNLAIETEDELGICQGDEVTLTAVNNVGGSNLTWDLDDGTSIDPATETIVIQPQVSTTYTATVEVAGCSATDQVTVEVDAFDFPDLNQDTTICQNSTVQLAAPILETGTTYEWTPNIMLAPDNTVAGVFATPDVTTTYTVTATSATGFCEESESITVTVTPSDVDIQNPDPIEICAGESVDINTIATDGTLVTWSPAEGLNTTTGGTVTATPEVSTTYIASLDINGCFVTDTVFVRVDSLPESGLVELIPDKEVYCEGEIITFVFPPFEPSAYPAIEHQWTPDTGVQSPDSLWNLVVSADPDATTYTRVTTNRGCSVTEVVEIQVTPVDDLSITGTPNPLCPGDTIFFDLVSDADLINIEWGGNFQYSCTDCPNPTAEVFTGGVASVSAETETGDCPLSATFPVTVEFGATVDLTASATSICPGDEVTLDSNADNATDVTWTDQDGNVISTEVGFTATPTTTTTYTVTASNGVCDPDTGEVTIFVTDDQPTITVSVDDEFVCVGDVVTLTADVSNADASAVVWEPNGETGASIQVTAGETFTYTASISVCDFEAEADVTVQVSPGFVIDSTTASPPVVFEGQDLDLTVFTTPPTGELLNPVYMWTINGAGVDTEVPTTTTVAPEIVDDEIPSQTIGYSIIITDDGGCTGSIESSFDVMNATFEVPNVFTPNSGELNNFFTPIVGGTSEVTDFRVFNRWGQVVYDNETPDTGWDGTFNEKDAPADVYVYLITYISPAGASITVKGDVTLVR